MATSQPDLKPAPGDASGPDHEARGDADANAVNAATVAASWLAQLRRLAVVILIELVGLTLYTWLPPAFPGLPEIALGLVHLGACVYFVSVIPPLLPAELARQGRLVSWLIFGFCITLPLLGPLCVTGLLWIVTHAKPPKKIEARFVIGDDDLQVRDEQVEPGSDMMKTASEILGQSNAEARRQVILSMRRIHPRFAVPLLQRALQDGDEHVRLFSQNILSGFAHEHEQAIKDLEGRLVDRPDDVAVLQALAERHHELVYLDLISDPAVQQSHLKESVRLMTKAQALDPDNPQILFQRLRYLIKSEHVDEAEACIRHLQELKFAEEILAPWNLEIQYLKGNWQQLRKDLSLACQRPFSEKTLKPLKAFWTPGSDELAFPD